MNSVEIGQLWNLMDYGRSRYTLRVERIDGQRVHGRLASGRASSVTLKTLLRGHRGAHLLEHADGTAAPPWKPRDKLTQLDSVNDGKTASDYVKEEAPRGLTKTTPKYEEALRLREVDGKTYDEIMAHFGITRGALSAWLCRAREARRDAALRELMRTG